MLVKLRAAFTRADPKSTKNAVKLACQSFLRFRDLGSISSTFYVQLLHAQVTKA